MSQHTKVAIVTSAGTGVSRATALALLRDGYRVVLAGRRQEPLAQVAAEAGPAANRAPAGTARRAARLSLTPVSHTGLDPKRVVGARLSASHGTYAPCLRSASWVDGAVDARAPLHCRTGQSRDAQAARQAMHEHLMLVEQKVIEILEISRRATGRRSSLEDLEQEAALPRRSVALYHPTRGVRTNAPQLGP